MIDTVRLSLHFFNQQPGKEDIGTGSVDVVGLLYTACLFGSRLFQVHRICKSHLQEKVSVRHLMTIYNELGTHIQGIQQYKKL